MSQPQKVKIKAAYYDESIDSVIWTVKLPDGREADLIWLREEFGASFNIKDEIPVSIIKGFCKDMVGKERLLTIGD